MNTTELPEAPQDPTNNQPLAWVGCLACYNAGNLNGAWCTAEEAEEWECKNTTHEEFWCMDMEGVPSSLIKEMSPAEFVELCEQLEQFEENGLTDAWAAYVDHVGAHYATFDGFEEAYAGHWCSEEHFAEELASDCGFEASDTWPGNCIDWERAARDLFMGDYTSVDAGMGVFVFRSC